MVAAYTLAGELERASGDHEVAFARYQERLRTFITAMQKAAVEFASFFASPSRFGMFVGIRVRGGRAASRRRLETTRNGGGRDRDLVARHQRRARRLAHVRAGRWPRLRDPRDT
jgi:2-polyprenyl-6-methoxyphenol hydroxylase-like FAD-dependent oxidoreductase